MAAAEDETPALSVKDRLRLFEQPSASQSKSSPALAAAAATPATRPAPALPARKPTSAASSPLSQLSTSSALSAHLAKAANGDLFDSVSPTSAHATMLQPLQPVPSPQSSRPTTPAHSSRAPSPVSTYTPAASATPPRLPLRKTSISSLSSVDSLKPHYHPPRKSLSLQPLETSYPPLPPRKPQLHKSGTGSWLEITHKDVSPTPDISPLDAVTFQYRAQTTACRPEVQSQVRTALQSSTSLCSYELERGQATCEGREDNLVEIRIEPDEAG